jgi:glycosyltransferase involved in cell wall biosynthesis
MHGMITVLLPAYDEATTIGLLVRACFAHTPEPCEVLVVDDGSADETSKLAAAAGARVVRLPVNQGKGVAVREGLAAARGDVVVMLDADGQDDPAEIPDLLAALTDGVDMVVGSRFRGQFGAGSITPLNYAGNRFLTFVLNALFATRLTDTLAGFKAVRSSCVRNVSLEARRYDIEVELLVRLLRNGARVVEIPVRRAARVHGTSRLNSFRDGTRVLGRIVRLRLETR